MNKVFKVIWNQATQSWVAVSELQRAKGKTKSVSEGSKVLLAGAGLALAAVSGNVYAATAITGQTGDGITISTTGGTAASTVTADSIAIGRGAAVKTVGTDPRLGTQAIAIGENAQTRKEYTIAIGGNADGGRQDGSVVIGNSAKGHTNSADNATRHTSYYNPFMPRNTWSANGQESSTHLLYSHKGEQQAAGVVSVGYKAEAEYGGVAVGDRAFAGDSSTVNRPEYRGLGVAVGANAWSQDGGVVIGGGAVNERQNGIAIARQAVSKGRSAIAVGVSSVSVGDRSLAVGSSATSLGDNSIAIGASRTSNERYSATDNVQSEGRNSIAMGTQARVGNSFDSTVLTRSNAFGVAADNAELKAWNDRIAAETARVGVLTENSIAVGTNSTVLAKDSMAIGTSSNTTGRNAIAIGKDSVANNFGSIAIGEKAEAKTVAGNEGNQDGTSGLTQIKAIAIGGEAKALHDKTVAVGDRATASGDHAFAMGAQALADKQYATAVGSNSNATGEFSTALGKSATASGNFGSAVGVDSKAIGVNSSAFGRLATANGTSGLAMGHGATAGVTGDSSTARNNAIAIGTNATSVGGHASIALGNAAKSNQNNAIAVGTNTNVTAASATAIGQNANVSSNHAIALGTNATVAAGFERSVALGAYSTVAAAVQVSSATVGGITYSGFAGDKPAVGDVVSVGEENARKRQIQNVAAGRINATSTDAINGSQLYLTQAALDNVAQTTANNFGGGVTVGADGRLTAPTYTLTNASGSPITGVNASSTNVGGALTNLNNYINRGFDVTDNDGAVKGTVTPGEKVQFANGNATTSTVTQEANGITKVQYNVEVDGSTIKIENGKLTAVPAPAATPTKLENGTTTTVTNKGTDAAPVYTVEVNKADVATAPTDTADADKITVNTDGKVVAPTDATKAGNTFVTAQNLADVVNNSGFTLKTSATADGTKDATSTADEVINPGETVEMVAGKNLTVKQEANGKVTYATKDDVEFKSVAIKGDDDSTSTISQNNGRLEINAEPNTGKGPITINAQTGTISGLEHNLPRADTDGLKTEVSNPNKSGQALQNAATVLDVLNAGWNLQGNGEAVDFVKTYDTVDFVNGKGTVVTVENKEGKNIIKVDSAIEFVNTNTDDKSTPSDTAKLTGDKPVQLGNVASGVRAEDGTALTGKDLAQAIENASGNQLNNAVNVGDLQAAAKAAKTEVKGSGLATVAEPTVGDNGQAIYTVDVAKADAPTVARGSVTVKAGDENKVMTAGDVAKAITDSERTSSVKAGSKAVSVTAGTEDANGNTEYVVDVNTDKTITRDAEGKLSVNTDGKTITVNEEGQVTAVTTNLTNSDKGAVNAPSAADAGKLVTAQTVADAINKSGFTAKANGDAGELINPGDEVEFINGKNIEITRDGGKFTVATAKDVTFDSVTFGDNGPKITNKDGNINVAGNDGSPTKITGVANGTDDNDAVNVSQLKAAQAKVEATGLATVSSKSDANGTVYTVDVAKADAPTVARGSVTVKAGDENKVMTAGDVAKAITDSERTSSVEAGSKAVTVTAGTEDANGNTEYVVDVNTDKTITRDADGKLSVNTGNSLKVDADSGKIDVNTDDKTITVNDAGQVTAVTTNLTNSDKGAVNAPSAEDAGKLVTAQTVADAINKSGFTLKTSDVEGGEKVSGDDEVINPGETVEMVAGKNLTVKQEANGKVTYATKENVEFSTVKVNDVTDPTKGGSVTVGGDTDGIQITSKPSTTAGEKPTNTITNLTNNLVDASKAEVQPSENSPANLGDKLNNAATVSDVLNAGWNLQGNGKAVDTVIHNDTVDFVNGKGTVVTVENKDGKNTIKVDSAIEFVNTNTDDKSTPSDTAKLTGDKPVQLGNVASGVRAEDGTALTGKDLAKAIDNASGDQLTNAVNVGDLQAAAKAAKTEVKGTGLANVTSEPGDNGQTIYTVDVAKADAPTVTDGAVSVKEGDEGKVMVAGDVAKAINESGFKLTATASAGEVEGTSEELINPSDLLTLDAGKNIKLVQDAGKITVATKADVEFSTVKVNDTTDPTKGGSVTVGGDEDGIQITSKPSTTAGEKPTNTITNLTNNLVDASTAAVQPTENSPANLGDKLNNAATVSDVLNAGWNLQGNGKAVDTVIHNDTVDFVNGKGTVVTVENKDGKNTIKVDSAIEFVNTNTDDKSTPSDTAKLTGDKPVQLGNVASGVRAEDGTALTGKDLAKAIENASGDQLTNAVNVGDLQAAAKAAKTEVKGSGLATVAAPTVGENGQAIYTVDVAKADAPTVTDGAVSVKAGDEGKVMVAGDVAKAINESGFKLTATASAGEVEGTSEELINPSDLLTLDAGKNIKLVQKAGKITVATKDDVVFNSVTSNTITVPTDAANPSNNPITITKDGISAGNKAINNVADGDISPTSKQAINGSQLHNYTKVNGNNIGTDDSGAINIVNGSGTTVTSTKPGEVKVNVNNTDLTVADNGTIDVQDPAGTGAHYVNATTVANAVNNVSWNVNSEKDTTTANAATKNTYTAGNNKVKAGETVKVNAGRNIEISGSGKTVNVAVSDNPEFETVKVGKGNNATTISSDADGVRIAKADGSPQRITNVAAGKADTDAVNVGQLKGAVTNLNNKINRNQKEARSGIAGAAAIAGLPEIHLAGKSMIATAASAYKGENAIAVGYSRLSDNSKVKLKVSGSADTSGDFIGTIGVGYAW